MGWGGTF